MNRALIFCISFFYGLCLTAQVAQDCANAVPICDNTPVNGGTNGFGIDDFNGLAESGCLERTQSGAIESNSAWYRFRTNASGQLGFNIGHDSAEDWDFALYQASDCSALGEPIRCNFFDNSDQRSYTGVGEDPSGIVSVNYEQWLDVNPGEDYYLLINNFSSTNSGFSIQFSGEIFVTNPFDALDCSIISNLLGPPIAACEGDNIVLDGTMTGAEGYNWFQNDGAGFQPITSENDATLTVMNGATYRVEVVRQGENIISDVQVAFTAVPTTNPISNDIFCHDDEGYDLLLKDVEALGDQDPSSYLVSYHNSQADAVDGIHPLNKLYQKNPPNPNYTYRWDTGEVTPTITISQAGNYTLTATSTAMGITCNNVRTIRVSSAPSPRITDIEIDEPQLNNTVTIITDVEGDFEYSLDGEPFQTSPIFENVLPGAHTVIMRDVPGCGSVSEKIVVVGFMNHFSPNGDNINDTWYVEGFRKAEKCISSINGGIFAIN